MSEAGKYQEYYEKFAARLFRHVFRLIKNESKAHEIVNEAFKKWMEKEYVLENDSHAWIMLSLISRRLAFDYLRRQKKEIILENESLNSIYNGIASENRLQKNPLDFCIQNEEKKIIHRIFRTYTDKLVKEDRELLIAALIADETYEKLSKRFGKPSSTLHDRVKKLKGELRHRLEKAGIYD